MEFFGEETSTSKQKATPNNLKYGACKPCKLKHLKCDGASPCSLCVAKKTACIYHDIPVRRGPEPGKAAELRRAIDKLKDHIKEQKIRNETLQGQHAQILRKMERHDMSMSGHLVNTSTLNTYVNIYHEKAIAFLQVFPPYVDLNEYYQDSDFRQTLMNAVFSIGALVLGNKQHSDMFVKLIENNLRTSFDDINPYVCAVHYLLSGYYGCSGDKVREMAYNARSLFMANILLKKIKRPIAGLDIEIIQKHSWIKQSLHAEKLDMLETDVNFVLNESSDQLSWTIAQLEHNALHWEVKAVNELDPNFALPTHIKRLMTVINLAETITHQVPQPLRTMLLMRTLSGRLLIHAFTAQDYAAHEIAQQILMLAASPIEILKDNPYFTLVPLLLVGQFYLLFGTHSHDFQKLLQVLHKVDSLNTVRGILLKEHSISTQDDMVAWCYFYPRLTAFREMNVRTAALQYGTDSRHGFYLLDPYAQTMAETSVNEHFGHNYDGEYCNPHEEVGHHCTQDK